MLAELSHHEGQHEFYNCSTEIKMHSNFDECLVGSCSGSIHIRDMKNEAAITIHLSAENCSSGGSRLLDQRYQANYVLGESGRREFLEILLGADGRLLRINASAEALSPGYSLTERTECSGVNPGRRLDLRKR